MIEFKADCGHVVRAKNDDAGKVVRCAYCGREAQVPADRADDFDLLFADVASKQQESTVEGGKGRPGARQRKPGRSKWVGRNIDPFGLITKMAYVAVVLIVLIFVGRKVWPTVRDYYQSWFPETPDKVTSTPADTGPRDRPPTEPIQPAKGFGLLNPLLERRKNEGLYVTCVPPDAELAYRLAGESSSRDDSWLQDPTTPRRSTPAMIDLKPGVYDVVIMIPINDKQLKRYARFGYGSFRRSVEDENNRDRDETVDLYFLPDTAIAVQALPLERRINIARYYKVTVRQQSWTVLTALFLPAQCTMQEMRSLLPGNKVYGFDVADVRDELSYYGVDPRDHDYIVDILPLIGAISYQTSDGRYRYLRIDPDDGLFSAQYLQPQQLRRRDRGGSGA